MRKRNAKKYMANIILRAIAIVTFVIELGLMAFVSMRRWQLVLVLTGLFVSACLIDKTEDNLVILEERLGRS